MPRYCLLGRIGASRIEEYPEAVGAPDEAWPRIPEVFNLEDHLARLA